MGLISSYFKVSSMAKDLGKKSDVSGSLASMQGKLDGLNSMMEAQATQQSAAADPASQLRRVDAVATVSSARLSGAQLNGSSVVELQLVVMLASGIPIPVTHTTIVAPLDLARVQTGARLLVTLDPANPTTLVIDWARAA